MPEEIRFFKRSIFFCSMTLMPRNIFNYTFLIPRGPWMSLSRLHSTFIRIFGWEISGPSVKRTDQIFLCFLRCSLIRNRRYDINQMISHLHPLHVCQLLHYQKMDSISGPSRLAVACTFMLKCFSFFSAFGSSSLGPAAHFMGSYLSV